MSEDLDLAELCNENKTRNVVIYSLKKIYQNRIHLLGNQFLIAINPYEILPNRIDPSFKYKPKITLNSN